MSPHEPTDKVQQTRLAVTCDANLPIQAILDFVAVHTASTPDKLLFVVDTAVEADPMRKVLKLTGFDAVDTEHYPNRIKRDGTRAGTPVFLIGTPEYPGMAILKLWDSDTGEILHRQEFQLDF